jgi:peroxiredoxin
MNKTGYLLVLAAGISLSVGFFVSRIITMPPAEQTSLPPLALPQADTRILGQLRPEFSLPDIQGTVHNIKEWDGKVILLNFWATWCSPCLQEIPELVDLQQQYQARGLQVIGIALQNPNELSDFIREHGMNYPVLAGLEAVIVIAESYGNTVGGLPYTAIIDKSGKIIFVQAGQIKKAEVESIITTLM